MRVLAYALVSAFFLVGIIAFWGSFLGVQDFVARLLVKLLHLVLMILTMLFLIRFHFRYRACFRLTRKFILARFLGATRVSVILFLIFVVITLLNFDKLPDELIGCLGAVGLVWMGISLGHLMVDVSAIGASRTAKGFLFLSISLLLSIIEGNKIVELAGSIVGFIFYSLSGVHLLKAWNGYCDSLDRLLVDLQKHELDHFPQE